MHAFTLAEVLITLGIIGVVAAMTIPTLVANYQKTQYVTQLKKAYSEFNQVISKLELDYGCPSDIVCTGLFSSTSTLVQTGDAISGYFKTTKNCKTASNQGCWSNTVNYNYDGSSTDTLFNNYDASGTYKFITAEGVSFLFNFKSTSNCSEVYGPTSTINDCMDVRIDVNGPKKGPNYMGRDIFLFYLTVQKGLYPAGMPNWNGTYWKNYCIPSYKYGDRCSGRILEEGWQMNY